MSLTDAGATQQQTKQMSKLVGQLIVSIDNHSKSGGRVAKAGNWIAIGFLWLGAVELYVKLF